VLSVANKPINCADNTDLLLNDTKNNANQHIKKYDTKDNDSEHNRTWYRPMLTLSVTNNPFMLSVTYKTFMLSATMLSVVMLSAIMLSVVAPLILLAQSVSGPCWNKIS
jgi:hypothetical protein